MVCVSAQVLIGELCKNELTHLHKLEQNRLSEMMPLRLLNSTIQVRALDAMVLAVNSGLNVSYDPVHSFTRSRILTLYPCHHAARESRLTFVGWEISGDA